MSNVLITGSSSGFGLLTAKALLTRGHTVFATMRGPDGKNAEHARALIAFAAEASGTVHIHELDVTSDASVETAVAYAIERGGLHAVVNNAGLGGGGFAEAFTVDQFRKIFEVNVYGVQRVARATLPAMRAQGHGLQIFISSTLGRVVMPFCGPYVASKFAVEGLAESYRYEVAPTGVEVTVVQPGGFGTGFFGSMLPAADEDRAATYGPLAEMPEQMWGGVGEMLTGEGAPDPEEVARGIVHLVETPQGERPMRVVIDPMTGGEAPTAINQLIEQIQQQVMEGIGMGHLTRVQVSDQPEP